LADIFLLGWAIGKKLFMFDPSCNAIENSTDIMETRANIYPNSRGRGLYGHISSGMDTNNFVARTDNINETQLDDYSQTTPMHSQREDSSRGGKKHRKTNKKSKKKRTRQTRHI
jgi:hypothetical protein